MNAAEKQRAQYDAQVAASVTGSRTDRADAVTRALAAELYGERTRERDATVNTSTDPESGQSKA